MVASHIRIDTSIQRWKRESWQTASESASSQAQLAACAHRSTRQRQVPRLHGSWSFWRPILPRGFHQRSHGQVHSRSARPAWDSRGRAETSEAVGEEVRTLGEVSALASGARKTSSTEDIRGLAYEQTSYRAVPGECGARIDWQETLAIPGSVSAYCLEIHRGSRMEA